MLIFQVVLGGARQSLRCILYHSEGPDAELGLPEPHEYSNVTIKYLNDNMESIAYQYHNAKYFLLIVQSQKHSNAIAESPNFCQPLLF